MSKRSPFRYSRTSPKIIRLALMLYVRFPLSLRNVEDLLHERGIDVSHEMVRYWWLRFGLMFASEIRRRRVSQKRASRWRWHLDEVFVKVNGVRHYLWRAIDHEGRRCSRPLSQSIGKTAALKFLRKLMKRRGQPGEVVTNKLRSYGAALKETGAQDRQVTSRWEDNRAENSHQPFRRRDRAMPRFRCMRSLQKFAAVHSSVHNLLKSDRRLSNRAAALAAWRQFCAA